jgi:glycosyltransferase involved in cell wall biosynthesis
VSAFDIALQPAANPYASPLKLFEYMSLGRAIVAPDQPNIREVLTHDQDALLFNPADRHGLVRAVLALHEQPDVRRRLGAGAWETVERLDLSWRNNAERVLTLARRMALPDDRTAYRVEPRARAPGR